MIKTRFRWWWTWNSHMLEDWLESMAAGGWLLESCSLAGTLFRFRESKPGKFRFCVDYLNNLDKDYEQTARDDNWSILHMGAGWYVFFKEYEERRPELYTDVHSLIERNNRIKTVLVATGIPLFVLLPTVARSTPLGTFGTILSIIWIPLAVLYIYAMVKLLAVNKSLKKKQDLSG